MTLVTLIAVWRIRRSITASVRQRMLLVHLRCLEIAAARQGVQLTVERLPRQPTAR